MLNKDLLTAVFQNIIPATFEDSQTYLEQLLEVQKVLNEVVDVVNSIVESGGSGFILEPATTEKLGGVKIGEGVNVAEDGTISVEVPDTPEYEPYELPIANDEKLGGVKIGEGVNVAEDGTISVEIPEIPEYEPYELPIATTSILGGVKIGEGINIDENGVISVVIPEQQEIKLGQGLKLVDGKITLDLGVNLYFTEDGKVNAVIAEPVVVTTGVQDSVSTTKDSSSTDGLSETIGEVSEELNFSKY